MEYKEYSAIINVVFNEEVQRLEEWLYSITKVYDCSEDKYWIKESPGGDIPSLKELDKLMLRIGDLDICSDDDSIVDENVDIISSEWMTM